MNDYEARQEARRKRYEELARKNEQESHARFERADEMASVIPFGQPILVGHHSEQRDRNYRNRIAVNMDKGCEALDKAKYYEQRAASVGKGGISSDDPDAADKLTDRLAKLEAKQAYMKRINAIHGRYLKNPGSLDKEDLADKERELITSYKPPYSWEPHPFAPFELTNNSANIRRIKDRIKALENMPTETKEVEHNGVKVVENADINRVQVIFPGKPDKAIRDVLKYHGFRWSPTNMAWQRHLNSAGIYAAECVLRKIEALS